MLKFTIFLILYIYVNTIEIRRQKMILLFGEKAHKSASARKNGNVKNNPVENTAILAMNSGYKSLLSVKEYDMCDFSQNYPIDYSMYGEDGSALPCMAFMSEFSDAIATLGDYAFSGFGDCSCGGGFSGSSSSSFSSVC